ncbi:MAG: type II secretion system F family protein [Phycisphaerales bacterium]|jgi:type II secretory pathway component PulF|nr:type II secretion system F family protein [Phycisphaerales bacterium]
MPVFEYEAISATGAQRRGVLEAASRADANRMLLQRGETATAIVATAASDRQPGRPKVAAARRRRTGRPSMRKTEIAALVRELATALEAGLPLVTALRTIRRQAAGKGPEAVLDHLIERVEAGESLHKAGSSYGPPFDDLILGMLRAADASGESSVVLHQLADLLERGIELRREVVGAVFYPLIVATLILSSAIILVTVLIPRLMEPLLAAGVKTLPLPTRMLLSISDFLASWWLVCIAIAVLSVMGWRFWIAAPENRLRWDAWKLRVPVLGRLLRDIAVARFTRTMGTLAAAGLPLLECLNITRDTLVNTAMMEAIDTVQSQVTEGKPLADPLEKSGLFPPLLVQVVNLGERSGRLETMLSHAATAFDRQVNVSIKLFTKAFPPLLIIIMAALGAFVLAAILLPLLELQNLAG